MNLRVTAQTQSANVIANIERQNAALSNYQNQVSSGVRVNLPSDDPTAYPLLAQANAASAQYATYTQNMTTSTSTLNASVSALGSVSDILTQARQIATEGADSSTNSTPGANEALATQVDALINQAISVGNTQEDGRYLFGGTATTSPPFQVGMSNPDGTPATVTYTGADQPSQTLIGPGQTVNTRYAGNQVFQQAGGDLFQTLIGIRDDLRNTSLSGPALSTALNQQLTQISATSAAVGNVTAEQSSSLATLQAVSSRVSDLKLGADSRVNDLGSTDYASAVVQMQQQETGLQATLAVSAQLIQPNLLSFIH